MTHSKNRRNGFTLIEVLLATAVFALVMTPLFILQGRLVRDAASRSGVVKRVLVAKNLLATALLMEPLKDGALKIDKKMDDPQGTLLYSAQAVSKKSKLAKFKGLIKETVEVRWQEGKLRRREAIVTVSFRPESIKQ